MISHMLPALALWSHVINVWDKNTQLDFVEDLCLLVTSGSERFMSGISSFSHVLFDLLIHFLILHCPLDRQQLECERCD